MRGWVKETSTTCSPASFFMPIKCNVTCLLVNFKEFSHSFPKHLDSARQAAACFCFFCSDTEPIICRFLFNQTAWAGRQIRMVPKCQPNVFFLKLIKDFRGSEHGGTFYVLFHPNSRVIYALHKILIPTWKEPFVCTLCSFFCAFL